MIVAATVLALVASQFAVGTSPASASPAPGAGRVEFYGLNYPSNPWVGNALSNGTFAVKNCIYKGTAYIHLDGNSNAPPGSLTGSGSVEAYITGSNDYADMVTNGWSYLDASLSGSYQEVGSNLVVTLSGTMGIWSSLGLCDQKPVTMEIVLDLTRVAGTYTQSSPGGPLEDLEDPSNEPPGAPTLVAPLSEQQFQAHESQVFTIRASDPEGDPYRGRVTVRTLTGGIVSSFDTAWASSGLDSSSLPPTPIPTGSYTFTAQAIDPWGRESAVSSSRSFSVAALGDPRALLTPIFEYTGGAQTYTVPAGVSQLMVEVFGAQGGIGGGLGGRTVAIVPASPGQVFSVYVGGRPWSGDPGGFYGGGSGGGGGSPGGGLSSLRRTGINITAGGGGGCGEHVNYGCGGAGGGGLLPGAPGSNLQSGGGGSDVPGAGGSSPTPGGGGGSGGVDSGGAGGNTANTSYSYVRGGGGGGGGFLGGGGGGATYTHHPDGTPTFEYGGSGGGGSGSLVGATAGFGEVGVRSGDGQVIITEILPFFPPQPSSLLVEPAATAQQINTSRSVTVTLKDQYGTPSAGKQIYWSRTGVNPLPEVLMGTTNSSGQVVASYVGANVGEDIIVAQMGSGPSSNPKGAASATWYTTTPPPPPPPSPASIVVSGGGGYSQGQAAVLFATVRDQYAAPMAGVSVSFARTGANPGSGTVATDQFGVATYSYVGVNAGADAITATAGNARGATGISWAPPAPSNNAPGAPSLVDPPSGKVFGSTEAQVFTVNATDPQGDPYTGMITITNSGNGQVTTVPTSAAPSGQNSSGTSAPPLAAGSYTWSARATDVQNAQGPESGTRNFSVASLPPPPPPPTNNPPGTPTLVSPPNGHAFGATEPQVFTINATDPNGDPYTGTVTIRNGGGSVITTFTTSPAPSGQNSSGTPAPPLAAGSYTWTAKATDAQGASSGTSSSRSFSVSASASNNPPGTPTLVSPSNNYAFGVTEAQLFTINATDPNTDPYTGIVTIKSSFSGATVATFNTSVAPSGINSSGSPAPPLPAGNYYWSARASDAQGAQSPESGTRNFSVSSGVANNPPMAPSLISPAAGKAFATDEPQAFAINTTDPDGDAYTGTITITNTGTGASTNITTSLAASGSDSQGAPAPLLPQGSYTWIARATDAKGAQGPPSPSRSFTVANQAPVTPTLLSPAAGESFTTNEPQVFTFTSTDPEGDPYTGTVTIRNASSGAVVTTFITSPTPSGQDSSGFPTLPVGVGSYTWAAKATDALGAMGAETAPRAFSVAINRPPLIPTLVSPEPGGTIYANEPQVFTINTTDPDGDPYFGTLTITGPSGPVTVTTSPVASGVYSTGAPAPPLAAGTYTWSATATDAKLAIGTSSVNRSFVVSADTTPVPSAIPSDGPVTLASAGPAKIPGNLHSESPSISADGRLVAFASYASDLVPADTNGDRDIFVYDRIANVTTRVSVDSLGSEANGDSWLPRISPDGRWVIFQSVATNLVTSDTNGKMDIFVNDRLTGDTKRVSVSSSNTQADDDSDVEDITPDGRFVVFRSFATNLISGDGNYDPDIFVRDRDTDADGIFDESGAVSTTRVSVSSSGAEGNEWSSNATISSDGRYVAFGSRAGNLVGSDGNFGYDVFVRDRAAGTTTLMSRNTSGGVGNEWSLLPKITPNGRYVAFASKASDLISGDGNAKWDAFVFDRDTDTDGIFDESGSVSTTRVSQSSTGAEGNGDVDLSSMAISAEGRYVAFASDATNMVAGDRNGGSDIFLKDRLTAVITLISHDPEGLQTNGGSYWPSMSSSALQIAFESSASNLVPADTNFSGDVFAYNRQFSLTCMTGAISAVGCLSGYGFKATSDQIGLEDFYGYHPFDLGSDTAYLNVANGNLVVQGTTLDIPGQGLNMRLTHTYNSQRDSATGPLGKGWRLGFSDGDSDDLLGAVVSAVLSADVGQILEVVATEDQFDFFDADGTRHHFIKGGLAGPGWHSPPGVNLALTDYLVGAERRYKAVRPDGVSYEFRPASGSSYNLNRIDDRKGNYLTAAYDATTGKLSSLTDQNSRAMNFFWSGDYLSSVTFDTKTITFSVNTTTGRLDSVSGLGRTVNYYYDTDGLDRVRDGRSNSTYFDLDDGMLNKVTDRAGKDWDILYSDEFCQPGNSEAVIATCIEDPEGNREVYTSSEAGNFLTHRDAGDPAPNQTSYLWESNRLASETDQAGNSNEYVYNQLGQVILKRESGSGDPALTTAMLYRDVSPGVADLIEARVGTDSGDERVWQFGKDDQGNLISTTDPEGKVTTFTYSSTGGKLLSTTDPRGNATSYSNYHASGQPQTITDPLGYAKNFTYDSLGRLTNVQDRNSNNFGFGYDDRGNITSQSTPNGTASFTYDANDNQTQSTPPAAAATNRTFDARDLITESSATVDGTLRKTTYGYFDDGQLKEIFEPRTYAGSPAVTQKVQYQRYANNRVSAMIDEEGNQTDATYTPDGLIRTVIEPLGASGRHTTTYSYNRRGQATSITESGHGNPTTNTYNLHGEKTSTKNPKGNVTTFSYDKMGRPTLVIDPAGRRSSRTYDPAGNLVTLTQPKDQGDQLTTSYSYTARNEIKTESDPADGAHLVEYSYDNEGRQRYRYDKYSGTTERTIEQIFRGDGKVTTKTASGTGLSTHSSTYGYDAAGNLTSSSATLAGANVSSMSVTLNGAYEPTSYSETVYDTGGTARTKTASYTYQPDGLLASRTIDGNTTNYTHTKHGLEATVTPWSSPGSFTNEHNPNGTLKKTTMPNGVISDQLFDPADRLVSKIVHRNDLTQTLLSSWTGIAYDDNDNRTSETVAQRQIESSPVPPLTPSGDASYSYDTLDRLTSYHHPFEPDSTTNYTLDDAGNIVSETEGVYTYQNNRLTSRRVVPTAEVFTYGYDHQGNQVTETGPAGTSTTSYNAASHTKRVTEPDASWVEYMYDGLDRMVRRQTSTGEVNLFFHDGPTDQIALETNNSGTVTTRYIVDSTGEAIGKEDIGNSTGRSYYIDDPRGNVTQMVDGSQNVVAVFGYDPYGKEKPGPVPTMPTKVGNWDSRLRFQKAPRDPKTGAYNIGPRVLDPNINRFVGADMYVGAAANMELALDPLTGNSYLYAGANPAGMIDDGHAPYWNMKAHRRGCQNLRARGLSNSSGVSGYFQWAGGTLCRNFLEDAGLVDFQQSVEGYAGSTVTGRGQFRSAGIVFDSGLQVFLMAKPGGRMGKISKSESAMWRGFKSYKKGIRMSGEGSKRRYYKWDHTHGDIEVYDSAGKHRGSMNPQTGDMYKGPEKGRKL